MIRHSCVPIGKVSVWQNQVEKIKQKFSNESVECKLSTYLRDSFQPSSFRNLVHVPRDIYEKIPSPILFVIVQNEKQAKYSLEINKYTIYDRMLSSENVWSS